MNEPWLNKELTGEIYTDEKGKIMSIRKQEFKVPLYNNKFSVILYEKVEEVTSIIGTDNLENLNGCVVKNEEGLHLLLDISKGVPSPGIIAHEAKHLVNYIFIDLGIELSLYNDEPEAYLLTWVVNAIHEILERYKIR